MFAQYLIQSNKKEIAQSLRDLLEDKLYTVVTCNEIRDYCPEVRVNQQLKLVGEHETSITIVDSYGVYSLALYRETFIRFSYQQVLIFHKSDSGNELMWVFAVTGDADVR